MAKLLDRLFGSGTKEVEQEVCVFSLSETGIAEFSKKEDRSEAITYAGIGRNKYSTGQPPTIYDDPITAVRGYPVVYGAITAISEAVGGLGVKVYQVKGGQKVEVTDHPFYMMFANPNPYQGSFEFLEELQQYLEVMGNAFISLEKVGSVFEMYLLNPKYVGIVPDPKIKVKEYKYYINGQTVPYKPEEIIHIKYHDVDDPYFGMPPLTTATDILTFEKNRLKFVNTFFVNGAIPVGVLETEQVLGETLLKKLRQEWSMIHKGVTNSHKVGILQGGLKYRSIASPLKDMDLSGLKKLSKEDILTIFKMPESVLGNQEGTGSKEGKDALATFWRQCLIPRIRRIESAINRGLKISVFGNGQYEFQFNLKEVAALQDDKEELSNYLQRMVASSIMTPNEARGIIGLPLITGEEHADKLMVSNSFFGNQLMPADAAAQQGAGSNQEKPSAKPTENAPAAATPPPKPAKPAPATPPPKKSLDDPEWRLEVDTRLANTGLVKFTPTYLQKQYGFGARDLAPLVDHKAVAIEKCMQALSEEVKQSVVVVEALREDQKSVKESFDQLTMQNARALAESTKADDLITKVLADNRSTAELQLKVSENELKAEELRSGYLALVAESTSKSNAAILEASAKKIELTVNMDVPPAEFTVNLPKEQPKVKKLENVVRDHNGQIVSADVVEEEVSDGNR